jgi:predicted amidophosphoribosyltransferase
MVRDWKNFPAAVLDLLFPPLCIACRAPVGEAGFCPDCWGGIAFLDGPACACCGLPFPVDLGGDNFCAACLAKPPAFDTARAILAYDEKSGAVLSDCQHVLALARVVKATDMLI